jgi:hypothetical protein
MSGALFALWGRCGLRRGQPPPLGRPRRPFLARAGRASSLRVDAKPGAACPEKGQEILSLPWAMDCQKTATKLRLQNGRPEAGPGHPAAEWRILAVGGPRKSLRATGPAADASSPTGGTRRGISRQARARRDSLLLKRAIGKNFLRFKRQHHVVHFAVAAPPFLACGFRL